MNAFRVVCLGVLSASLATAIHAQAADDAPTPLSLTHSTQVQEGKGQIVYHAQLRREGAVLGDSTLVLVHDQVQRVGQVATQQYVARCTTQPADHSSETLVYDSATTGSQAREPVYSNAEVTTGEFVAMDLLPGNQDLHLDLTHSVLNTMQTLNNGPCRIEMPVVSIHGDQKIIPVLNPGESTTVQFDGLAANKTKNAYTLTLTRW